MENSNNYLDVIIVQSKSELEKAIEKLKKYSNNNILYMNCESKLKIGDVLSGKKFNACLRSEDSDTIIFFQAGKIEYEEIEKQLQKADIQYSNIVFQNEELENYKLEENEKEVWLARDDISFKEAIDDSLSIGNNECVYITDQESNLTIAYKGSEGIRYPFEGRFCRGTIIFEDKIILLIKQGYEKNLSKINVLGILKNRDIKVRIKKQGKEKTGVIR